jgi:hypothetical protein
MKDREIATLEILVKISEVFARRVKGFYCDS